MDEVIVENEKFYYNKVKYTLEDMMDEEFYIYSDEVVDKYKIDGILQNEIYYTFVQQVLAICKFINDNKIKSIVLKDCSYKLSCFVLSAVEISCINIKYNKSKFCFQHINTVIKGKFLYLATIVYLFLKLLRAKYMGSPNINVSTFSIVRLNQEYTKFGYFRENKDIWFDYENIKSTLSNNQEVRKLGNVYNHFKSGKKIKWLVKAIKSSRKMLDSMTTMLTSKINVYASYAARDFYVTRIMHTALYEQMLDSYFKLYQGKKYITGKLIDRYGLIEDKMSKKYNVEIINYPHGIEYGFKLPYGFVGNKVFATSKYASEYFNKIYKTDKFVYDYDSINILFNKNIDKKDNERKVVFFTEAHEQEVNIFILKELQKRLKKYNIKLYIKPHPKENINVYKQKFPDMTILSDFGEAITKNICLARRSTILVEALYNKSIACSILVNSNDYSIYKFYPSLQDKSINVFFNINDLTEFIKKHNNVENI